MFVSVHRAVCEQSADPAGAVQTARGRAAGSTEGNARQGPGPGEGVQQAYILVCERKQSVKHEWRQQARAAVDVLKIILLRAKL